MAAPRKLIAMLMAEIANNTESTYLTDISKIIKPIII
jgi:hypothetical protein